MRSKLMTVLIIAVVAYGLYRVWTPSEIRHPPGVLVNTLPRQTAVANAKPWKMGDYQIMPQASFELEARVLAVKRYRMDREAELAPYDLALGWGAMSDQKVLDKLEIDQGNRFYYWRTENFPVPRRVIETSSANMHMIPANDEVKDLLGDVQAGDIVRLGGYLVFVTAPDGWRWKSSLTRGDTGAGACEVIWVERFAIQ